jgi:hypothetical protein
MTYAPDWDRDVERGSQGELYWDAIVKVIANRSAEVEVKRDSWWPITGRLYVELEAYGWDRDARENRFKPSGLSITKAKLWVFVAGKHPRVSVIETDWLRRAVAEAKKFQTIHTVGQDGDHPTRGYYVYENFLMASRDTSLDEHIKGEMRDRLTR